MKKIKLIFGMLSVVTLVSCSDFLTKEPKGTMDEDRFFTTQDAGFKSLIKCYQMLNDFYRFERPRMDLYNISTDDAEKGGSDAGDGQAAAELTSGKPLASNTDLYNLWEGMYMGIARCNTLIEKIPVADMIDAAGYPLTKEVKARYMAEARFLRAFYHFELCKIFGGVPIVDKTLTVAASKSLVRATEAETASFIIDELKAIADDESLPSKLTLSSSELGRVTREAVWAMQARVYMYFAKDDEKLCADARDAAKRVIDSGNYELEPDYQDLYRANGYLSRESIFVNIRGDVPSEYVYGSFLPCYASPRSTGAYGFDQPTQNLVDEFENGDPRLLYTIIEPGDKFPTASGSETLDFSTYPNTGYHSRKVFLIESRRGPGWGDDAWSFHHIRYADVLLLYAEALIRTDGDKALAVKYINDVRTRADNSRNGDKDAVSRVRKIANKHLVPVKVSDDLLAAVKHERRVELAMEYNRLYDLKRWNCYTETMNAFAVQPYANGRGAAFRKGVNEVFPIPQSEIDRTGGSIKQNNGYN
ncbi:MAG: RagB/SusD family nutrient uptake outer membrane protein [Bacteroidales bacterium]|nr:RagB/SusD family nutrient uptake outer membrane protein [Bacteroidales bacterium]